MQCIKDNRSLSLSRIQRDYMYITCNFIAYSAKFFQYLKIQKVGKRAYKEGLHIKRELIKLIFFNVIRPVGSGIRRITSYRGVTITLNNEIF